VAAAASGYEAFPAKEAPRLVELFDWHHTPKHGVWLDMAESELSVLSTQCLDRRIADKRSRRLGGRPQKQAREGRLADHHTDARIKLKRLYHAL
jgi:hypothetical protein